MAWRRIKLVGKRSWTGVYTQTALANTSNISPSLSIVTLLKTTSFTYLTIDALLVLLFVFLSFHSWSMLHAKPRLSVDVGVDILFVIAELDVVPLGIIKRFRHGLWLFSILIAGKVWVFELLSLLLSQCLCCWSQTVLWSGEFVGK